MNGGDLDKREWIRSALDEHEGPLTLYVTRLLGDVERARDVVQDAFLKLWQADRATVEGHLVKWLYTVCRNRALDVRRKEHRMTTLENESLESHAAQAHAGASNAEGGDRSLAGVLAIVSGLSERQQEVVRLKFQGGLSYKEIAGVMDTTVNNVGVLLHTAIKTIRGRLAEATPASSTATGAAAAPGAVAATTRARRH